MTAPATAAPATTGGRRRAFDSHAIAASLGGAGRGRCAVRLRPLARAVAAPAAATTLLAGDRYRSSTISGSGRLHGLTIRAEDDLAGGSEVHTPTLAPSPAATPRWHGALLALGQRRPLLLASTRGRDQLSGGQPAP